MAYGLKIYRPDGSLFVSPDVTPLNYVGKFRFSAGNGTIATPVPASKSIVFFVRHDAPDGKGYYTRKSNGTTWNIAIREAAVAGYLYVFANYPVTSSGYGIAVYNQSGQMTWNTDCLPLQIRSFNNPWEHPAKGQNMDVGFNAAVIPGVASTWVAPIDPAAGRFLTAPMLAGASGKKIYITPHKGKEVGGGFPAWRYKNQFVCIDTAYYP